MRPEPAILGSFGEAPPGERLPEATRLGGIILRVSDLARSLEYYTQILGLRVRSEKRGRAVLTAHGDDRPLVTLDEHKGARPHPTRGRLGLFHFAILLPERAALARFVRHLGERSVQPGAGDHGVSEAFYLADPDGLGIEIYADRPRETWQRRGRELAMGTDAVDLPNLLAASGEERWSGMPTGTVMGHLHLHVGDLERTNVFYHETLGLDRIVWSYPGALFLSAGGYHHHLGTNLWAGPRATAAPEDEAQLLEWRMELPSADDVLAARSRLTDAGYEVSGDGDSFVVLDPFGTPLRIATTE